MKERNMINTKRNNMIIAKSIILFSLCDKVFNHGSASKISYELWKTINKDHDGTKDVANEKYHVLIGMLNSFKQFDHQDVQAMYSQLNVLVNGINSLGVKQIEDIELIRKILHSLRRLVYDLVTSILYEKELNTLTPNQILNKVIACELCNDTKPRAPPSSPTHSALTSKQERLLKKMAIKRSSSEEEESQCSSSDEDVMPPNFTRK